MMLQSNSFKTGISYFFYGLIMSILAISCNDGESEAKTHSYSIIFDITDTTFHYDGRAEEVVEAILKKSSVDTSNTSFTGINIYVTSCSDLTRNPGISIDALPPGDPGMLGDNPLDRIDGIKKFKVKAISQINNFIKSQKYRTDSSQIYCEFCNQINDLNEENAEQKTLIIFSDMLENSNLIKIYSNTNRVYQYLHNKNDDLIQQFEDKTGCTLPDLKHFNVCVITYRDSKTDSLVALAERFWKKMLKEKGCDTIHFSSGIIKL